MSERSLEAMLEERIQRRAQRLDQGPGLSQGTQNPVQRLEDRIAIRHQRMAEATERQRAKMESFEGSMLDQWGIDQRTADNSTAAYVANMVPDIGSKLLQGLGRTAAAPFEVSAAGQIGAVTPEQIEAFDRLQRQRGAQEAAQTLQPEGAQAGQVDLSIQPDTRAYTEADAAVLAQRAPSETPNLPANHPMARAQASDRERREAPTALERLESRLRAREISQTIQENTDATGLAYDGYREDVDRDLLAGAGEGLAEVKSSLAGMLEGDITENAGAFASGTAKLLVNAGAAFKDNPKGFGQMVTQEIAEDLGPLLLLRGAGGHTANIADSVGRGAAAFNRGIDNFVEKEGRAPNSEEQLYMAEQAMLSVGSELIGDFTYLRLGRFSPKQGVGRMAYDATAPAGRLARGTAVGAVAEGAQTRFEGEAEYDSATAEEIYQAAATGAGVAGGVGAPTAAAETGSALLDAGRAGAGKLADVTESSSAQELREAVEAAESTGDVSALVDREASTYAPDKAVEVLNRLASTEGVDDTQREAYAQQADQVVGALEAEVGELQEAYEKTEAKNEDGIKAAIETYKTRLAELPEDADPAQRTRYEEAIQVREDALAEMDAEPKEIKQERRQARAAFERANRRLEQATNIQQNLRKKVAANEDVDATVEQANQPAEVEGARESAVRVVRLAMEESPNLTPERAQELADNTGNALTETERAHLRAYSESQRKSHALKTDGDVRTDIFRGGKGYVGIEQYRQRFANQIRNNNGTRAMVQVNNLKAFAQQRAQKAAVMEQALAEITDPSNDTKRIDYVYDKDMGEYVRSPKFLNKTQREQNGALVVTRGSARLYDQVVEEADVVQAAANELEAAYNAFTEQATQSPSPAAAQPETATEGQETTVSRETAEPDVIATTQQSNTETESQEVADEVTTPAPDQDVTPAPETATEPDAGSTGEPATTQSSNADTQQSSSTEATQEGNEAVTEEGVRYDEQTGEIIEESPAQNNDPETNGEGQLSVLEEAGERHKGQLSPEEFKEANLVQRYLRQDVRDLARRVTKRPLVEIRNFVTQLRADGGLAQKFVSEELNQEQKDLLQHFARRAAIFNDVVKQSLVEWNDRSPEFRYQDYIGYFRNEETGEIDENVLTAISYAMYSWLADNATLRYHDKKGINHILNRDSKTPVTPEEAHTFSRVGHRQNYMLNDMGRRASEALGLTADNGVPQDVLEKVQGALGGRAVLAMLKEGLLERTEFTETEMASISGRVMTLDPDAKHTFLRVPLDDSDVGRIQAEEIVETHKGTQGVLSKLFGVEDRQVPPSFKPKSFKGRKPKRSQMALSKSQEKILDRYNKTAYYVREEMLNVWSGLGADAKRLIAGGVDMTQAIHAANHPGAEGKNNALDREIGSIDGYVTTLDGQPNGRKTPFYMDWEVWKMGRMGIRGSMVNPQSSKVHRHLIKQAGWDHEVRIDNEDGSMDAFYLGVADALGIKTDSQLNETSIEQARDKMAEPVIEAGVVAILKSFNGEALNDSDQQAIVAAVQEGGENMHTFDGLVAIARFVQASEAGEPTFTHTLTREIDGKTNGPMLTQWLMGAANSGKELLNTVIRGGFFRESDGVEHIGDWARNKDNLDLYQMVAKTLNQVRAESLAERPGNAGLYEAIDFFVGKSELDGKVTKYGRNLVKTPVTALNFGSATNSVVQSMGKEFVQAIHDKIQKVANESDPAEQEAQRQALVQHFNTFLGNRPLNPNTSLDELLRHEIRGKEFDQVMKVYKQSFGQDIKKTLDYTFAPLIHRRNAVNKAASAAFMLYDAAYRNERQKYVRELLEKGELTDETYKKSKKSQEKGIRLMQDLTPEQEAEVRARVEHLRPIVNTAFSKQDGDREAGLMLAKQERMTDGTYTYANTTKQAKGFGVWNIRSQGSRTMQVDPGVGTVIWMVHSSDAFIAANAFDNHDALNVHDALITGLGQVEATARDQNKYTFEMLLNYSPAMEVMEAYSRTLQAFVQYAKESDVLDNPHVRKLIQDGLENMARGEDADSSPASLQETLREVVKTAWKAEQVKLDALAQLHAVSQYTMEGGQYILSDADRQRIGDAIAAFKKRSLPEGLADDVKALVQMLSGEAEADTQPEIEQQSAEEAVSAEPEPVIDSDADNREDASAEPLETVPDAEVTQETAEQMLSELEANPGMSPKALINVAMKGATPAMKTLLERLKRNRFVAKVNVNIHGVLEADPGLFTRKQDSEGTEPYYQADINLAWLRERVAGRRANPNQNQGAETIAEVIAHELVHAATVEAIYDTGSTGKRVNARLTAIQRDIKAWMTENPEAVAKLDETTRHQLQVMSERVAEIPTYGMTAKRIQNVLRRIPSRQSRGSAWSRFVNTVREALGLTGNDATVLDEVIAATDSIMRSRPEPSVQGEINLEVDMGPDSADPMQFTTQQIFDSLADGTNPLGGRETAQLQKLLDQVVSRLHGPAGAFKERAREAEAVSAEDVFLKSLAKGQAPFVSATRAAGFKLNDQQAFVLEQVEATLRASLEVPGSSDLARRELSKVWKEARGQIKPETFHDGDWATATDTEKAAAQAKHDFLFKLSAENGSTEDHLARFGALAMVDPALRARMEFATDQKASSTESPTLAQRLTDLFKTILSLFHARLTKTYAGQRADDKVWTLMDQLVDIEGRRRARLNDDSVTWQDRLEEKTEALSEGVRDKVVDLARSDFIRRSRNGFVKGGSGLVAVMAAERGDELMNHMEEVRQRMFKERQGLVASLISEARGAHDTAIQNAHKLLRKVAKKNEQERLRLHDVYRQAILESFENNGKDLTRDQKAAMTRILMDTDMVALMDDFSQEQLLELVESKDALKRAVAEYEGQLKGVAGKWFDYYLGASRDLGHHMATGDVTSQHLMLNAHNIASLYGTKYQSQVSEAQAEQARKILDPLISLYALQKSSPKHLAQMKGVMRQEVNRGDRSGVLTVLEVHRKMQQQALDVEFNGERVHMQKGYRTQIYNPHKSVAAFPMKDRKDYEAMGYQLVTELSRDPHDPEQEAKGLFVILDGGKNRRLTGVISYTNESVRGTTMHGGITAVGKEGVFAGNQAKNQKVLAQRDNYIDQLVRNGSRHQPKSDGFRHYQAPVLNPNGEVVNYRYLMKQDTKDTVLDRNNAIEDVFGAMASQAFDKVASREQNRTAIEALKAQFDAEYAENPGAYVRVSATSEDKQLSEAYRLLPDDAKKAMQEVWGDNEMWVRGDLVDVNFGYQKYSMADILKKLPEERKAMEKVYAGLLKLMFGDKAFLRARQIGGVWSEIVKEVKDILVVKTGLTLLGNVTSNVSLLLWHGVSVRDLARDHRVALEGVMNYRRDYNELQKLQLMVDTDRAQDADKANQRIRELQRDLEKNPVAFMIDEGLMPTIVEDVDMHDDPYSYKSQLAEKTEKWTGKVWSPLRTVGKYAYMTHDTPLYKALSQGTQVSDFVARYTLYQHLTTRKRHRMGHDEAIQRSSDMFINYDVPTHRIVQYLNDIGVLRFTKYYLRIQRAILTLYREHPARGMLMVALNSMMPGLSLLTDSSMTGRIGNNPLEWGALDYPGVLDELATVKTALSPFN